MEVLKTRIDLSRGLLIFILFAVTGPYAEKIFGEELGANSNTFMKTNILVIRLVPSI